MRDGSIERLTSPLPPPAMKPRLDERVDEGLRERRERLDHPDPEADVRMLLEHADDVVAAAERRPEPEKHDLDDDEDAEERYWPSPAMRP